MDRVEEAVAAAMRSDWGRVVAATASVTGGDLGRAEECAQEAFVAALWAWRRGVPDVPVAWLVTTARRRAIDQLRRDQVLRRKLPLLVEDEAATSGGDPPSAVPDERLRLVFTCCHPAISPDSRIALTLRLVCGLTTAEVARAFLVGESAMAARLTRAKEKVRLAGIPYRVPRDDELPDRLPSVLACVHQVFTAGHAALGAELVRLDLVDRAEELARLLVAVLPEEPGPPALLALMLLTDARRPARLDAEGRVVPLAEQDRTLWDRGRVAEGLRLIEHAATVRGARGEEPGRFEVEAGIAACHDLAPTWAATDWTGVVALYRAWQARWPSPVVALNLAVARGELDGPAAALADVEAIHAQGRLRGYAPLHAARGHLLAQLGRSAEAAHAYDQAAALAGAGPERAFLAARAADLRAR